MTRSERAAVRLRQDFHVGELAKKLRIAPPAIYAWKRMPERHVAALSKLTRIPPHELRPDLFKETARKTA